MDGPPSPVTWHLRDGGHGLAGFAARWDADPGVGARRTLAASGSAAVPGPGAHTLHLRVFDRAGTSADITYLYLYDVEPPTSTLRLDPATSTALTLHWSGNDGLSGVKAMAVEVAAGSAAFRPWFSQATEQPSAGRSLGAVRFLGDPGSSYQLRLTLTDAARNPAPPVVLTGSIPAAAAIPATVADHAVLGALPAQPEGELAMMGVRQEHPSAEGALLLGTDASLHGLGGSGSTSNAAPTSVASAVDVATLPSGPLRLLADGTTWNSAGAAGPRFSVKAPVRLLGASDGSLIAIDAGGAIALAASPLAGAGRAGGSVSLSAGATLVDAALFPGSHAGLALDSAGAVHAFGAADAALSGITSGWTLPAQPVAIALSGTPQAPAGIVTDASGDWQTFGSMLLLPDATFGGPLFDSTTGLPVR